MKRSIHFLLFSLFLFWCQNNCIAQADLQNGYVFPVHTGSQPIHVLLVPVELSGAACDGTNATCFPAGQLPIDIDKYFDHELPTSGPINYFTKYLYQSSFGQCVVLADYLEQPVQLNYCPGTIPLPGTWASTINAALRAQFPILPLHYNTPLNLFDNYSLDNSSIIGAQKIAGSGNTKFDCVIYLIGNYYLYGGENGYGSGILGSAAPGITNSYGVDLAAVFGHQGSVGSIKFIMEEFFHGMFGGNNWHSGTGRSNHTFFTWTHPWGIESQSGSSQVVSGYDRMILNWNNPPDKIQLVSARSVTNTEINSDLKIPTTPITSTFILRDFVTSGDAIRIQLPHITCSSPQLPTTSSPTGPEKNEYLWLENHQLFSNSVEDQNRNYTLTNSPFCGPWVNCGESWSPGILASIQVGKDVQSGPAADIYSPSSFKDPNSLASWMFPLQATGNFDYTYGPESTSSLPCIWNNNFVGMDFSNPANTKSNPFSGFNFMFGRPNTNGSSELNDGDFMQGIGYYDINNQFHIERNLNGDLNTSFKCNGSCPSGGKEILSLSTNPSPVTIMTLTSKDNHLGTFRLDPANPNGSNDYLNRTVYLNGISIKILAENFQPSTFGNGAKKIEVTWNNYDIINDVRWCADSIRLSPNDFDQNDYSLIVKNSSTIWIDRSKSPTYDYADANHLNFTVPTVFSCLPNSKVHIEANSSIVVDNGSILEVKINSQIILEANSKIIVKNGSRLVLEPNSLLQLKDGASVIIEEGATVEYQHDANIKLDGATSVFEINGLLDIKDNATFKFSHTNTNHGYFKFNNASSPSRNITCGNNCYIDFTSSSSNFKFLEIDQETFYAPANLVQLKLNSGKVVFNSNSRLQADGLGTSIDFNNVRFTSNTPGLNNDHRGVHLYGQSNVSISTCTFEYGRYGIYAYQTYGGIPLNLVGCIFRHNTFGIRAYDKGLGLYQCNFFNNEWGVSANQMSFPSVFLQGLTGGGVANSNSIGIRWQSYATASLTLNDPLINTNTTGVKAENCPLNIKCGSISYNNEGIVFTYGADLFMNDLANGSSTVAKVSVFNNNYSIRSVKGRYLDLNKGESDISPSTPNNQRSVFGSLLYDNISIDANNNTWNTLGTFSPADYYLLNPDGTTCIINSSPPSLFTACGQAIPPCPNPPCPNQSPLEYCPTCDVINTDDFAGVKLNIATKDAIAKLNSNDPDKYKDAVSLFYQILNEQYSNPDDKEKYLLGLDYVKMMEALGNAFKYNQIICTETGLPEIVSQVISIQNKLIDAAIISNNLDLRLKYSMDKAQTLRLACSRDECVQLLNQILEWCVGDDEINSVNLFICQVNIENMVLNGTILPGEVEEQMASCNQGPARMRNDLEALEILNPPSISLTVDIYNHVQFNYIDLKTNAEKGHVIMLNSIGEIVHETNFNYDCSIDVSSFSKGIYIINTTNINNGENIINKVVIN